jgi:hypothetical protein
MDSLLVAGQRRLPASHADAVDALLGDFAW